MSSTVLTRTERPHTLSLAALVAAPVVAIIARLLWIPFEEDDSAAYLADVADHPDRQTGGSLLMILSAALLIPAAVSLAAAFRDRQPVLARAATAMIGLGAVGMACMCTTGIVAAELAEQPERDSMVAAWDAVFNGTWAGEIIFLAVLVGVVGFITLAVGLYRSGAVARPAAVLAGLGGAAVLFTSGGPVQPMLVAAAVVALAGFAWAGARR